MPVHPVDAQLARVQCGLFCHTCDPQLPNQLTLLLYLSLPSPLSALSSMLSAASPPLLLAVL
jgi:hypothetical protein